MQNPGTIGEAQARIDETLAYLKSLPEDALSGGEDREIALSLPNGFTLDMTGFQYLRDWALPQMYFHTTTAYAILRNLGVGLGKADYVPHALAYVRRT